MSDLKELKSNLKKNPAAREKFISDFLQVLKNNGVDIDDPEVLKSLNLDLDTVGDEKGIIVGGFVISIVVH